MQKNQSILRYLALGDSYTIGESVPEEDRAPVQLVRQLRQNGLTFADPDIIAKTGWKTEDLIKAIRKQKPDDDYDLVSLLIGVNNQYRQKPMDIYKKEFDLLLQEAISLTSGDDPKKVLVISIPDYGYTPFGEAMQEQISRELDQYNAINEKISVSYGVWYVDITDISRGSIATNGLIAGDNLHPSAFQYELWVKRILNHQDFINHLLTNQNEKS